MSWITWTAVLVAWPLAGLAIAYVFGRFTHGAEVWGHADDLAPPVVSYLRREKRVKASPRATHKVRREALGGRRSHSH
jgi:hypothetical protein